jgi:hypothetical protein
MAIVPEPDLAQHMGARLPSWSRSRVYPATGVGSINLAPHAGSVLDEAADQDWRDMTSRRHSFRQG